MGTKHNKNIKKLSTAIRRGKAIADENGINHGRGKWLRLNKAGDKIECACAMGMALIGKIGVDAALEVEAKTYAGASAEVEKEIPVSRSVNSCFVKEAKTKRKTLATKVASWNTVQGIVITMNDETKMTLDEIADTLESCKL